MILNRVIWKSEVGVCPVTKESTTVNVRFVEVWVLGGIPSWKQTGMKCDYAQAHRCEYSNGTCPLFMNANCDE